MRSGEGVRRTSGAEDGYFHFLRAIFACSDASVPAFIGPQKNAGKVPAMIWLWLFSMLDFKCNTKKGVKRIRNDAFTRM